MIVLIILAAATLAARVAGFAGVASLNSWPAAIRAGLASMLLFTSVGHFNAVRFGLVRMMPPAIPYPMALVYFTGLCEIAGAIGLLIPRTRIAAAVALIVLFVAVLPANLYAAQNGVPVLGQAATPVIPRILVQVMFIALTYWAGIRAAAR